MTLQDAIDRAKSTGIKPKDFNQVEIELDWSNCYYEGDWPEIKLDIPEKLIKK